MIENYGQIKVVDGKGKPLPKVYAKTFVRTRAGEAVFYKDGYTDLRGRFDYASVNSPGDLKEIKKFAIFVMDDELGSMIKEADPPSQIGKINREITLKSKKY